MKTIALIPFIFTLSLTYADFGKIVECPENLKKFKTEQSQAECRQGMGLEISIFNQADSKIYIDQGSKELKVLNFETNKAYHCLDLNPNYTIHDVAFNPEIGKWIIYKSQNSYGGTDAVYLVDKDYALNKFVVTLLLEYEIPLSQILTFKGSIAKIVNKEGEIFSLDVTIPSLEQIKRDAFNFYEMRSTSWKFMEEGLGSYPSYYKNVEIFKKCEAIANVKKKERCFQNEGELLQLNILEFVKANFKDNYETQTLKKYLGDGNKKMLKELYIANPIYRAYKAMKESQVLNLAFKWENQPFVITNTLYSFGSAPSHQLTYDLNLGRSYFSIGQFAHKPGGFSVRYAYYPIAAINWVQHPKL